MWKRGESDSLMSPEPSLDPISPAARSSSRSAGKRSGNIATIGPSIKLKGEISGNEDLLIQGRVEGSIMLKKNNVTVGENGYVKANLRARSVLVEGEVKGDVIGDEQVVLRRSARVEGNISSPRVTVEDGASFRGGIDMRTDPAAPIPAAAATKKPNEPKDLQNDPNPTSSTNQPPSEKVVEKK